MSQVVDFTTSAHDSDVISILIGGNLEVSIEEIDSHWMPSYTIYTIIYYI